VLRSHLLLFFCGRKDRLCVCVRERERECVFMCLFVCVYRKEKESLRVCLLDNRNTSMIEDCTLGHDLYIYIYIYIYIYVYIYIYI